jgi:hypothetical protein
MNIFLFVGLIIGFIWGLYLYILANYELGQDPYLAVLKMSVGTLFMGICGGGMIVLKMLGRRLDDRGRGEA